MASPPNFLILMADQLTARALPAYGNRIAKTPHIDAGEVKFVEECSRCHALGINVTPDLRRLNAGLHAEFKDIVLHGVLGAAGMERFDDILSERDVENIHAYLIDQSWVAYHAQETAKHP